MKRLLDFIVSLLGLILLSPVFLIVSLWIKLDSKGTVFFRQARVGRHNKDFILYKFRSMGCQDWGKDQLITVGDDDPRITRAGYVLRRLKLDELPQLINVLKGDMSLVGPRPLVRQQVELYPDLYAPILSVRPGITSNASIYFRDENALLGKAEDPEAYFRDVVMPKKIELNLQYVQNRSMWGDIKLLFKTVFLSFFRK
ncbi:sugar transferase [Porphyromonas circumdentaria]|uniref:Sugar transferase involved in LPS biosynthesis (Colanic, teichoic acid) n=1 Tax=Porphyromonas circumdentaria TaxID=29524 RepID=A0A1T4PJ72_9PORP|nr:sugar transferase [Porphyromonas circumdentaria]MBB6276401.1 lipopolysaccharide/colanic/teichoic acid biosynthesis glycosyltransferase [Porphyromonas circumdentaria]MDO4722532.1 sugar transferase [Porphyromonas circumdentaria]SJZ91620.1 Sugar transferase involved in LPS biosynthesis (colanic, teichoic acid) [Porphyromonas circumdentaria]